MHRLAEVIQKIITTESNRTERKQNYATSNGKVCYKLRRNELKNIIRDRP